MILTTKKVLLVTTLVFVLGNIASINAQTYCSSGRTPWNYWISKVNIGTTSYGNGSSTDIDKTTGSGYTDRTGSAAFQVNTAQTNTMTVQFDEPNTYIDNGTMYWAVWIDLNSDGDFIDANEQVASANFAYTFGNKTVAELQKNLNLTIPTGSTGSRRMRVACKYNQQNAIAGFTAPTSCETATADNRGEVEDYTVTITGGTTGCASAPTITCPATINITAASGATTAMANFMTATASSPCGTNTTINYTINGSSVASNYAFPIGTTTVNVNATHISNNIVAVCSFTVVVTAGTTGNPTTSAQWDGGTTSANNVYRMGRVAIGTTNFGSDNTFNLLVRGGIRTEKIKMDVATANQWADYVFAKDYVLKPLKEVKQYIDKNKHLPNVPSADELTKQGLDVMQMMAKQQEKIEELYLYMIQLNEVIAKQQAEIKALKAAGANGK
jgi:GEVED domain/HYR domain